ncbi:MAG: ABC transporter permease subunit [Actinobacteria bacterium]|nr:ABC transporter permease subunit [Actinomycetota bacterium]
MRNLLAKDTLEQFKTYRFLIAVVVFLMFGLASPVLMKMLPRMIPVTETQGGLQMKIIGEAALTDAASQYLGLIGQMGILLVIIFAMGAVAGGGSCRVASMLLSKPVSRRDYLLSKYFVNGAMFIISIAVGTIAFYGYSVVLYGYFSPAGVPLFIICTGVFFLFVLALTILFSTLMNSSAAAGGLALLSVFILSVIPGYFKSIKRFGPGYLLDVSWSILARSEGFGAAVAPLIITSILVIVIVATAVMVFNGKDI